MVFCKACGRKHSSAAFHARSSTHRYNAFPLQWDIPDLAPPKIAGEQPAASRKRQAEFGSPGRYFSDRSLNQLAQIGRRNIGKYAAAFDRIERRTGVPRQVVRRHLGT